MKGLISRLSTVLMACMLLFSANSAYAQNKVSGTVVDESGLAVIGAGVVQKGTSNGVATDLDGNFTISVPEGAMLEISFLNYNTQVVPAKDGMKVVLVEDTESLEEVVVVGYGVQKKSDLTGAISSVKDNDLQARTITSPESALQGKTAGVQLFSSSARPGASPTVRIRGISSNGSSDPLYVVDGQITNSISNIDPNDIQSMEVLKDGASAAIYGARAGNGVILITTKKGSGDGHIGYEMQLTAQSLGKIPEIMNAKEYIQYYIEDGRFTQDFINQRWDGKTDTNWVSELFETSFVQRHSVKFDASNDKGAIYASLSYLNNNGMFVGDEDTFERITGMLNASWKIKPWLDISSNNQLNTYKVREVSERASDSNAESENAFLSAIQLDPLTPVKYSESNLPAFMKAYLAEGKNVLHDAQGNYYAISQVNDCENINPLILRDARHTEVAGMSFSGTTALNLKPFKGFTFTSRVSYRFRQSSSYGYTNDYYANTYKHQEYMTLSASISVPSYYQIENFANYMTKIGDHNITAMAGMSYSQNKNYNVGAQVSGSESDFGVTKDDPLFYFFQFATPSASKTVNGGEAIYQRNLSYYGRLGWSYKNRYMAQVSLRADAADSSVLPMENRWGYFPAASFGWTITEEPFMEGVKDYLPYLKLRASWGQNGSTANLNSYGYASVIGSAGIYPVGNSTVYYPVNKPTATGNNGLKWETSEQFNVGVDTRFFNNKLTVTADWFLKKTKDLLVAGFTPSTLIGVTASPLNAGNVNNSGFELELAWQDQIGDFNYGIRANAATLKNVVTYLHPALENGIDGVTYRFSPVTKFEKGYPAWHYYGYKFIGVDPSNGEALFEDVNKDGVVSAADKTDLGSGIPKVNYGLTLTAGWKNFDVIVFGSGAAGHQIFCALNRVDYAVNKLTVFTNDRWTPSHTNATNPRAGASTQTDWMQSSASVFSGNYFKIKQIQLGYTLPKTVSEAIKISNARVYVSLEDYFTFTKYPGLDPEVAGVGNALGVDMSSYPNSKKAVFGFSLSF
ncbi:MAG: TonB-dependent receptor [Bacteroidales bacterium]|nr:TonB-dependent receptor [Bacteroidales bacterium]